jgi:hypothetical protein
VLLPVRAPHTALQRVAAQSARRASSAFEAEVRARASVHEASCAKEHRSKTESRSPQLAGKQQASTGS